MPGCRVRLQRGSRPVQWLHPKYKPTREEKKQIATNPELKERGGVVELTHSWFNRFLKLIPRYEKTDCSYQALTSLAAAQITLNNVVIKNEK